MSTDAVGKMVYAWSDGTITDEPGANDASRFTIVALRRTKRRFR
ncbi:MAG: hypothetical protein U5Q44_11595 [Dehalococcoidia bacterium]|nr:hypothetical protein [Dehalococcoidia bacterium]